MARDPFAPVTQPSVPSWAWLLAGTFALLMVLGITLVVVVSHKAAAVAVTPAVAAPVAKSPVTAQTATASTAAVAPDKAPEGESKDDKADSAEEKHHKSAHHAHKAKGPAVAGHGSAPAAAPAATPPRPKKKSDLSQKEIDNLLGL